jgi:hypothetical protein
MKSRLPQDLVDEDVPEPGDESLVHECRLDLPPSTGQELEELPTLHLQGVWPEPSKDCRDLARIVGEPQSAELAHVAIPELPAIENEHDPVVTMPPRRTVGPRQVTGHPEMDEHCGTGRPGDEPLPVAIGLQEPVALQSPIKRFCFNSSEDPRVCHQHSLDRSSCRVLREKPAEVFDVGKLRHLAILPGTSISRRTCSRGLEP